MTIQKIIAAATVAMALAFSAAASAATEESPASQASHETADLTIVLEHVPADTPKDAGIYIAGTFNGWIPDRPDYRLTPDGRGHFAITLPAKIRGHIEFKFTLGSWKACELDATGAAIANRSFIVPASGTATYSASVLSWGKLLTPEGWRKAAAMDLTAMHDLLRDNAPQMFVDRDSSDFRKWLEAGYTEAQGKLLGVKDYNGYVYLLRSYAGGFHDGHLGVSGSPEHQKWPGFTTVWKDGAYVVSMNSAFAKDRLPPAGAKLIACDGRTAEDLARSRLDKYFGNLNLYEGRAISAPFLVFDVGNLFVEPLKTCRFQLSSGIEEYALAYRPFDRKERIIARTPRARFGLEHSKTDPKIWRIGIPAMNDQLDWRGLYSDIEAHLKDIRAGDRLIIDLRGNGGGTSRYATELASHLWGDPVVNYYEPFLGPILYPATPVLRQDIADVLVDLRKQSLAGKIPQRAVTEREMLLAEVDKAIAEGRETITIGRQMPAARGEPPENPMKAQVFLVTDHACFSACLDLMDLFQAIPNVYHAGTQTGADTIFMEAASHQLPSGQETLRYGHKAWIKRPRGSNVPYTPSPALTYSGDLADEAAFEHWLATLPAQRIH